MALSGVTHFRWERSLMSPGSSECTHHLLQRRYDLDHGCSYDVGRCGPAGSCSCITQVPRRV